MGRILNKTEMKIKELKHAVKDLDNSRPELEDDLYLLRFLKTRGMDVKKAERMLRDTIQWRKDKQIDELVARELHPELAVLFPIHKATLKNGAPLAMLQLGKVDLKGLIDKYGKDEVYEHIIQHASQEEKRNIEWTRARFKEANCDEITENFLSGNAFFVDFKDMPLDQLASVKALGLCMQLISDYMRHFPILGATCIAINCARLAMPFINVLTRIAERPSFIIETYDTNREKWKEAILRKAEPDNLPTFFGGNIIVADVHEKLSRCI